MLHVWRYLDPLLVQRLNNLQMTARSVVAGAVVGHHRSPLRGASIEFRQHRPYGWGDEIRHLDWRLLGRTDRPFVRDYHEETNLRAVMMIDSSGSMAYGGDRDSKYAYALRMAAGLSYMMLHSGESVGLAVFRDGIEQWLAPQARSTQLGRIFEMFDRSSVGGPGALEPSVHAVAARLRRRSLVLLFTDLFAPIENIRRAIARLRYERHEVIVMQVLHPDETNFPFSGFTRFHGLEQESPSLGDSALLRPVYIDRLTRHLQALDRACRLLRVALFRFTTDRPLDEAIVEFVAQWSRRR